MSQQATMNECGLLSPCTDGGHRPAQPPSRPAALPGHVSSWHAGTSAAPPWCCTVGLHTTLGPGPPDALGDKHVFLILVYEIYSISFSSIDLDMLVSLMGFSTQKIDGVNRENLTQSDTEQLITPCWAFSFMCDRPHYLLTTYVCFISACILLTNKVSFSFLCALLLMSRMHCLSVCWSVLLLLTQGQAQKFQWTRFNLF